MRKLVFNKENKMNEQEILVIDTIYNSILDFFKQKFDKKKHLK